jgi:Lipocalin-like domain
MLKKFTPGILAVFVLLVFIIPANAQSENSTIAGTWKLISYEDHFPDGKTEYPFGKVPVGLLIYTSDDHMSVQIMKTPHPKVASGGEKITKKEKLALFDSYIAYFGTYSVDWKTHIVTHRVEGNLFDAYVGTDQPKPFELKATNYFSFRNGPVKMACRSKGFEFLNG